MTNEDGRTRSLELIRTATVRERSKRLRALAQRTRSNRRHWLSRAAGAAAMAVWLLTAGGCMSLGAWINDYVAAEKQQKRTQQDMLIFYKDYLDVTSGDVHTALRTGAVKDATEDMVRCVLVTDYEPDRAYVAQFGVMRSPALIVLRSDGTYHARVGPMTEADILDLLQRARSPGDAPRRDPFIPRPVTYRWINSLPAATAEARRSNRPLLIFYKWWVSNQSLTMQRTLEEPEVGRATAGFVHCRLEYDYLPNRTVMETFGVTRAPTLVVQQPDGSYRVLDGPATADEVVRFVRGAGG